MRALVPFFLQARKGSTRANKGTHENGGLFVRRKEELAIIF